MSERILRSRKSRPEFLGEVTRLGFSEPSCPGTVKDRPCFHQRSDGRIAASDAHRSRRIKMNCRGVYEVISSLRENCSKRSCKS
jgi:hypothetical protein